MARSGTFASLLACSLLLSACGEAHEPANKTPANAGATDCYSPEQNLDRAYEAGAKGCPCDVQADEDRCLEGIALVCSDGRWQAVIDGPCWPWLTRAPPATVASATAQTSPETVAVASAASPESKPIMAPPAASSYGPREACEPVSCTPYGYCDRDATSGALCRAKRNAGAACNGDNMCASGKCASGKCRASEPDRTKGCTGTWDCSESTARTICGNRDCEVCVQSVSAEGIPNVWAALEKASSCDCPEPTVR